MATTKLKGTSKKIKELKGIKPEKITDEQLEKVQSTINKMNRIQIELGAMEVRKHDALHSISALKDGLKILQDEFKKEYGTYDINIETGEINYEKENGEVNKKD